MFNTDILQGITVYSAALVPIILSIVQALKMTGWVKDKFTPFVSIGVGIVIAFLLAHDAFHNISSIVLSGILFGLASSGLYSGLTTTAKAIKEDRAKKEAAKEKREAKKQNEDPYKDRI